MQSNVLFRNDFDDYKDALQLFISGFFVVFYPLFIPIVLTTCMLVWNEGFMTEHDYLTVNGLAEVILKVHRRIAFLKVTVIQISLSNLKMFK